MKTHCSQALNELLGVWSSSCWMETWASAWKWKVSLSIIIRASVSVSISSRPQGSSRILSGHEQWPGPSLPLPRLQHTMCSVSTLDIYTSFVTVKVKVKEDFLNTSLAPQTGARGLAAISIKEHNVSILALDIFISIIYFSWRQVGWWWCACWRCSSATPSSASPSGCPTWCSGSSPAASAPSPASSTKVCRYSCR